LAALELFAGHGFVNLFALRAHLETRPRVVMQWQSVYKAEVHGRTTDLATYQPAQTMKAAETRKAMPSARKLIG